MAEIDLLRTVANERAERIAELEAALRKIIDRAEHRMSSKVIDDVVIIAREVLRQYPASVRQ